MPTDSLWSFCMALNVYLTFYKRYTTMQLKSLEWKYFLGCYGIPLIPSVTLLCVNSKDRGKIYGPAIVYQGTWSLNLFSGWFLDSCGVLLALIGSFCVFSVSMDQCGMTLTSKKNERIFTFIGSLSLGPSPFTSLLAAASFNNNELSEALSGLYKTLVQVSIHTRTQTR